MTKFTIPVPGNLSSEVYGKSHYAVTKKNGNLAILGINAPERIKKQYDFWFDDDTAKEYGLDLLPRTDGEDDD